MRLRAPLMPIGMFALVSLGASVAGATSHDGRGDFDFNLGTWHTHLTRKLHPLSSDAATIALDGSVTFNKIWDGTALYEEIEADGPAGHWEGMTVFLYNPRSHQWSQRFASSANGQLQPATIGAFAAGIGRLYAQDSLHGRSILVRGIWSEIRPTSHMYQEAYSEDGGRSWDTIITARLTRSGAVTPPTFAASTDGGHDFDFDLGDWRTHTSRLVSRSGRKRWVESRGVTHVTPIWGGRASIARFEADGPSGSLSLLSLRLFDPTTRQWSLNFAARDRGVWSAPMIGEFRNGFGTFYDQEEVDGQMALVRVIFTSESPDRTRSEQAISTDGGRTWQTNRINRHSRIRAAGDRRPSAAR